MSFFQYFPNRTNFPIEFIDEETRVPSEIVNITFPDFFRHVSVIAPRSLSDQQFFFSRVDLLDGERPEQLSYRLYGSVSYYWTFFFINDNLRLGEILQWPMSSSGLNSFVEENYSGKTVTVYNNDHIESNELCGKFIIGEQIKGMTSGIQGTLVSIRPDYGQMIIQDISGSFEANFRTDETLIGLSSGDSVTVGRSINFADSIYKYFDGETGREINNSNFINISDIQSNIDIKNISFRDHLISVNESLKNIKVLKRNSLVPFVDMVKRLLKKK